MILLQHKLMIRLLYVIQIDVKMVVNVFLIVLIPHLFAIVYLVTRVDTIIILLVYFLKFKFNSYYQAYCANQLEYL